MSNHKIIYTKTDEAPMLATFSFLPILKRFAKEAGIAIEVRDISLAGRLLSAFPDFLTDAQKQQDDLAFLGELVVKPEANVIKLPNISASIPQLKEAIEELQGKGYALPNYPDEPSTPEEEAIQKRYNKIKGSAVNPVLREGNSDRRAPLPVKQYAKAHPHRMAAWSADSKTHVATMEEGDFCHNEVSLTLDKACEVDIVLDTVSGQRINLMQGLHLQEGEIIDGTYMSVAKLKSFLAREIAAARDEDLLFSLHMKATMMKVSDPIIFGHAVKAYFADLFDKHGATFDRIGVNVNNGFGDLLENLEELSAEERDVIKADIAQIMAAGPAIAMVNSDEGITNLHVPSDVIIDASMPAMIRNGGKMWNAQGETQDTKAVIPDSSYANIYTAVIEDCKKHGAYDPTTMGTVPNVGLMAQKAEEYGSHNKTFEVSEAGTVKVVCGDDVLMSHDVEVGDIWRMCQVKDAPIQNWIKLAVGRARATQSTTVFWLDANRPHDAELIKKIDQYLPSHDTEGLDIRILSPYEAAKLSVERIRKGEDTISVTGNVLRDYNTDLFPILELGTSAKMLSIVPLMNGGGLFETGAGGSAPKHVDQVVKENHLRWNSLGEFLALAVSLDHLGENSHNNKATILGKALDEATVKHLAESKGPSRKVNEPDNRTSHYYLARYWAEALAEQQEDETLAEAFKSMASDLAAKEETILGEYISKQGESTDLGGYYLPDEDKVSAIMRPSATFNEILEA